MKKSCVQNKHYQQNLIKVLKVKVPIMQSGMYSYHKHISLLLSWHNDYEQILIANFKVFD